MAVELRSDPPPSNQLQPLLHGELAREARAALRAIVRDVSAIVAPDRPRPSIHLLADYALLLANAGSALGTSEPVVLADEILDEIAERFPESAGRPELFGGYPGVAMTVGQVERLLGAMEHNSPADDSCSAIDEALLQFVMSRASFEHYDLISGLCGYGTYFLSRSSRRVARRGVEQVIDRLAAHCEETRHGITWITPADSLPPWQRKEAPDGHYNLGVAHGVPGLIPMLALAVAAGPGGSEAKRLLEGAVAWTLSQRQDLEAVGALFPGWTLPEKEPSFSRLAWCYGDAGVGAALLNASQIVGREDWQHQALDILRLGTRRAGDAAGVKDPSLCHGAAGLGHIFNLAFQVSAESVFASSAIYWFRKTLEMRRPAFGVGGFWYYEPMRPSATGSWVPVEDPVIKKSNFLEGSVGVGLALATALNGECSRWDHRLLLSQGIRCGGNLA